MKAILVTCPHCGARLQVGDSSVVRCEYCGTDARVQRRTMIFDRVKPPPVQGPRPVAVQHVNPTARRIAWFAILMPVVIIGVVTWQIQRQVARGMQVSSSSTSSPASPRWQGTQRAILVDVDGDGTVDLVGRSRRATAGDAIRVIALDGATGKVKWESEPLGSYGETYQGRLAVAGDVLIFASPRAEVRGLALATGKTLWETQLDERVKALCAGDNDTVVALGADDVARPLRRRDGTRITAEPPPAPPAKGARKAPACAPLQGDTEGPWWERRDDKLGQRHELSSTQVVEGPGGRVLAGQRKRGTQVATLVGLDDTGGARWKVAVPRDPLGAPAQAVESISVGATEVCVAYVATSPADPMHVACFALADGARRWDEPVEPRFLRVVQILGPHLVITAVGTVQVREVATGARVWAFGG